MDAFEEIFRIIRKIEKTLKGIEDGLKKIEEVNGLRQTPILKPDLKKFQKELVKEIRTKKVLDVSEDVNT